MDNIENNFEITEDNQESVDSQITEYLNQLREEDFGHLAKNFEENIQLAESDDYNHIYEMPVWEILDRIRSFITGGGGKDTSSSIWKQINFPWA